jgi:hypothetical protein
MMVQSQRNYAFQDTRANFFDTARSVTQVLFTNQRVRVQHNRSHWNLRLRDRFDELTSLPVGWDGYAGCPVSFNCALFAASLLERICREDVSPPSLVPGSDGSLQIEWHRNQYDVEIDVLGPYNVVATRYDHMSDTEETLSLQSDFTAIAGWIEDLATTREGVPQGTVQ